MLKKDHFCLPCRYFVFIVKGIVHHQIILLNYVILITVNKHLVIIITNYTWYHRHKEIIRITGGLLLWLHRMPDSKAGRKKSYDVTWARNTQSSHRHELVFPVLLVFSSRIPLSSKQSESSSSCNGSSGSNWYCWMSIMI